MQVLDVNGKPVSGAQVSVDGYRVDTVTDADGVAKLVIRLKTRDEFLTLRIRHETAGELVDREVPFNGGGTRLLQERLDGTKNTRWYYGAPRASLDEERSKADEQHPGSAKGAPAGGDFHPMVAGQMCNGHSSLTNMPTQIRVARRQNNSPTGAIYRIDTMDYQVYARKVLAQEWITSWPAESLRSGSMAVKTYAWNRATREGGRTWNNQCYDVDDTTNYQVYRDSAAASTDQATADVWAWRMYKNGQVFNAQYRAGSSSTTCGADNLNGTMMRQWGTKKCADLGKAWKDITDEYFFPITFA